MQAQDSSPLQAVADRLIDQHSGAMELVLDLLSSADANVAQVMPHQGTAALFHTLHALLLRADDHGDLSDDIEQQLAELAWRVDEYGFTQQDYQQLERALHLVIEQVCADLPFKAVLASCRTVSQACAVLAAHTTDALPTRAEVVEVERRCRQVIVVRLITAQPLDYAPGQFVEVSSDYVQNRWVPVHPSLPANEAGMLEVHVHVDHDRTDPYRSLLANSRPGDTWKVTNGFGGVDTEEGRDLLFVAHGTGLAAARSMILELQMYNSNPPRVHLFVCADYPGELYDLFGLWQLASACPWLSVVPVVRNETDQWWVGATDHSKPPRGLHLLQTGEPGDIVASYGAWSDRIVYLFGAPAIMSDTAEKMVAAGTPADNIHIQTFSHETRWGDVADLVAAPEWLHAPTMPVPSPHAAVSLLPASPFAFAAQPAPQAEEAPHAAEWEEEADASAESASEPEISAETETASEVSEEIIDTAMMQPQNTVVDTVATESATDNAAANAETPEETMRLTVPASALFELAGHDTQETTTEVPLVDLFSDANNAESHAREENKGTQPPQ